MLWIFYTLIDWSIVVGRACGCVCVLTKFTFLREKCGKSQNNHSGKVWEILDNRSGEGRVKLFEKFWGLERFTIEGWAGVATVRMCGDFYTKIRRLKQTCTWVSVCWVLCHRDWLFWLPKFYFVFLYSVWALGSTAIVLERGHWVSFSMCCFVPFWSNARGVNTCRR